MRNLRFQLLGLAMIGSLFALPAQHRAWHGAELSLLTEALSADSLLYENLTSWEQLSGIREEYRPLSILLGRRLYQPPQAGNTVEIIESGPRKYELLMADLERAQAYIHLEYYRFTSDESGTAVRDMLIRKAREGVKVRCIVESLANPTVSPRFYKEMEQGGVEVLYYHNFHQGARSLGRLNNFDHHKIVVIDGAVAYTGGMNLNDHYFRTWRDTHVRICGPGVRSLQGVFLDSWFALKGKLDRPLADYFRPLQELTGVGTGVQHGDVLLQIASSGREWKHEGRSLQQAYIWALDHAKAYFYMQNPYFAPPQAIFAAMKRAAERGVDVRIMIPEHSDWAFLNDLNQSYYRELLQAGVRFFHRRDPFMHSKTFVSDDYLSSVGTANMDARSLALNYEDNAFFFDEAVARFSCQSFLNEQEENSYEVFLSDTDSWGAWRRFKQQSLRLIAPQM